MTRAPGMERAPQFSIPLADLEHGERELDEAIPPEWLAAAFADSEATPSGEPGRLEVTVSKTGREVMVRGRARAKVTLPCARTLDPAHYQLEADIFLLLGPPAPSSGGSPGNKRKASARGAASQPARGAREARPKGAAETRRAGAKPGAPVAKGGAERGRSREEPVLEEQEAARDTYEGERVVLDPFVREVLVLELPMFPLREDLRSETTPAIDGPQIGPADSDRSASSHVDPRLAPLAALKSRLREKKE